MIGRYLRMQSFRYDGSACHVRCKEASMATTLKFLPGSTICWRATRFIVVDYADIDGIIARELGKRKLERILYGTPNQIGHLATRRPLFSFARNELAR